MAFARSCAAETQQPIVAVFLDDRSASAAPGDTSYQEMIIYAIASRQVQETVDLFRTRQEAEAAVREILHNEPRLARDVFVAEIELDDPSLN